MSFMPFKNITSHVLVSIIIVNRTDYYFLENFSSVSYHKKISKNSLLYVKKYRFYISNEIKRVDYVNLNSEFFNKIV